MILSLFHGGNWKKGLLEKYNIRKERKSSMYELIQAAGDSYYIESPAKIGLVRTEDGDVCLIDSGNDKDAGRRVRQILDANGWKLKAIYNTHSNADHIGGNCYLQKQTGCRVFAPGIERCFTAHPVLEPSFLYGGYPPADLRHKFLMAAESDAEALTEDVLPEGMEIIPLPGHFFDMVGFRTSDDAVYLADCLSSRETLDKYGVTFIYDVDAYLRTLEMVKGMKARIFIPSHAAAAEDVSELADYNIKKVHEAADRIYGICSEPLSSDEIIRRVFREYGLSISMQQYVLIGSTVRSYLAWMKDNGRINTVADDGLILWERS